MFNLFFELNSYKVNSFFCLSLWCIGRKEGIMQLGPRHTGERKVRTRTVFPRCWIIHFERFILDISFLTIQFTNSFSTIHFWQFIFDNSFLEINFIKTFPTVYFGLFILDSSFWTIHYAYFFWTNSFGQIDWDDLFLADFCSTTIIIPLT